MKKFFKNLMPGRSLLISFLALLLTAGLVQAASTIGTNITTTGTLSVTGSTTLNTVEYGWPSADGSSGQVITTNGAGVLSWAANNANGWTDAGTKMYPTTMADQQLIGTTTVSGLSQLTVEATSTAGIPLTLRGYNGQSANLFQIQNVGSSNLFAVNSSGGLTLANGTTIVNGDASTLTITEANTAIVGALSVSGATTLATASSTGTVKFATINSDTGAISFGDENLTTTGDIAMATASSTGLVKAGTMKVSSLGDTISDIQFGTCTVTIGSVTASSTAIATCTATGVTTDHKVFITPYITDQTIIFSSASSTANDTIQVAVYNTGTTGNVNPADNIWSWMAIK